MPEVRRLRAEGYTFASIHEALLDAGVSVSLSTLVREASYPPSQWQLELEAEVPFALEGLAPTDAMPESAALPQSLDASKDQADTPTDSEPGLPPIAAVSDRRTFGLLSKVFRALRQLRRSSRLP